MEDTEEVEDIDKIPEEAKASIKENVEESEENAVEENILGVMPEEEEFIVESEEDFLLLKPNFSMLMAVSPEERKVITLNAN